MKVLFDHELPFRLAHGGFQIQIEQTRAALEANGVEVEPLRWWDAAQTGDLIHYFGRPPAMYFELAKAKGSKLIMAPLLTGVGSRPPHVLFGQRLLFGFGRRAFPKFLVTRIGWNAFLIADAVVSLTAWEGSLLTSIFGVPPEKVRIIPNGIEQVFLRSPPAERGPWLVCTATITERKRALESAQAAVQAQTPLWIIGKAYAENDPYARQFFQLAAAHPKFVRFEGPIDDRTRLAQVYREARGFVLLSTKESLSLSALEAAACECPLLLSDLPWARETFRDRASYCPIADTARTAAALRTFYDAAPKHPIPAKPQTWRDIARQFIQLYEDVLAKTSR